MIMKTARMVIVAALVAAGASAANNFWNNSGGDGLWRTGANWSDGVPTADDIIYNGNPSTDPMTVDDDSAICAIIYMISHSTLIVTTGSTLTAGGVLLNYIPTGGAPGDATVIIDGGRYTSGSYLNSSGTVRLGAVTNSSMTLNILNGGSFYTYAMNASYHAFGTGKINVVDGTLDLWKDATTVLILDAQGLAEIGTRGKIIAAADRSSTFGNYRSNGYLYVGDQGQSLRIAFDAASNKTYVVSSAVSETGNLNWNNTDADGLWRNAHNWYKSSGTVEYRLPVAGDYGYIKGDSGPVTIDYNSAACGTVRMIADATLIVTNGGTLTVDGVLLNYSTAGNATVTLDGGVYTSGTNWNASGTVRLGAIAGSSMTLNILNGGRFYTYQINASYVAGGTGKINLLDGVIELWKDGASVLNLDAEGTLEIGAAGTLILAHDYTNLLRNYIAAGYLYGSEGRALRVAYDAGQDKTFVTMPPVSTVMVIR